MAKTPAHDHQIGVIQQLEMRDVDLVVGVDLSRFRIDGEKNRAVEAMMAGEDLGEHWECLFRTILFVPGQKHNFQSVSPAFRWFVDAIVLPLGSGLAEYVPSQKAKGKETSEQDKRASTESMDHLSLPFGKKNYRSEFSQ
jgi:hypothetical protein